MGDSPGHSRYFLLLPALATEQKRLNHLRAEFLLNNIYKFSSYLTGNTLRLRYKAQPVNGVWGNSRCLL
jgi:hypothetical protein